MYFILLLLTKELLVDNGMRGSWSATNILKTHNTRNESLSLHWMSAFLVSSVVLPKPTTHGKIIAALLYTH